MQTMRRVIAGALLILASSPLLASAQWREQRTVSLGAAHAAAAAVENEARASRLSLAIVVLDNGGRIVLAQRMDGARYTALELAEAKARTALLIGRDTRAVQQRIAQGNLEALSIEGLTALPGGAPIVSDGAVVGAIGVSGASADDDERAVNAAIAALIHE